MNLEVIISTMNNNPRELVKKMNISSNAIIINQCNETSYEEFIYNNHSIRVYNFNEKGIGLSRNNGIMRTNADIVLFADDDEVLVDNYSEIIINEFNKNNKADFIVFDVTSKNNSDRSEKSIESNGRVRFYNCLKYGAVRFAIKTKKMKEKNIFFSTIFGGGAIYGSGEDSLFIYEAIKKGLKVFKNTNVIANVDMSNSTWFNGYNEKYYHDKGALFCCLPSKFNKLFLLIDIIKNHKTSKNISLKKKIKLVLNGYNEIKKGN